MLGGEPWSTCLGEGGYTTNSSTPTTTVSNPHVQPYLFHHHNHRQHPHNHHQHPHNHQVEVEVLQHPHTQPPRTCGRR